MSMKKTYRIKKEKEFQAVINRRDSYANRNLILFIKPSNGYSHFRVGFSVGKKVGNAVCRNRIKRQLRAGIYRLKDELPNDLDFVLIARPHINQLTAQEIDANIQHICRLAKII